MIGKNFLTYLGIISFLFTSLSQAELLKTKDIIPETREDIISQYLTRSDTLVLVCVYESRYVPVEKGDGILWYRSIQSRVVQSLRGNLLQGDKVVIRQISEKFPNSALLKKDDLKGDISIQENGELWYVFLNSKNIQKNEDGVYEVQLDTMWLNPLAVRLKDAVNALHKLLRIEPAKIVEESEAAKYHSQKK